MAHDSAEIEPMEDSAPLDSNSEESLNADPVVVESEKEEEVASPMESETQNEKPELQENELLKSENEENGKPVDGEVETPNETPEILEAEENNSPPENPTPVVESEETTPQETEEIATLQESETSDIPGEEISPTEEIRESPEENDKENIVTDSVVSDEPEVEVESQNNPENEESNENTQIVVTSGNNSAFSILTPDIIIKIFSLLDIVDLVSIQLVSQDWFVYARCDTLWSELYETTEWTLSPPELDDEEPTWYHLYQLHYEKELDQLNSEYYVEEEDDPVNDVYNLLQSCEELTTQRLRQLFEMEDFVSLLQNGDDMVLSFLELPTTIITMMNLLFKENHNLDDIQTQRTVHITVQTLVSGIITDVFIVNPDLLSALFDQLDELDLKADGAQAKGGCIAKIISILFEKFTTQMIDHMARRETMITTFLLNVHDQNLMEVLLKFVDCDLTHKWLFEAGLVPGLISLLHNDETIETQEHTASVLVNILALCQSWPQSVLINDLLNNELITGSIIAYMETKPISSDAIQLGLRVLIGILGLISDELEDPPLVVTLLANSIGFFAQVLQNEELTPQPMVTTTGAIEKAFGFVRLGVLELLVALLYTGFPIVVEFMVAEQIFTIVLDLLFQFPWNNIVHNQISQMYSGLFCCNNPEIIQSVLDDSRLPERISEAHKSENSVGYLGHLRELANELVRASKMSEVIAGFLNESPVWQSFTEDLKEFNLIECVVQDDYLDDYDSTQEQYNDYGGEDPEVVISEDFGDSEEF